MNTPCYVTRPLMPTEQEYAAYVSRIFASQHLTNHGPFSQELEIRLAQFLETPRVNVCANGTIALQLGLHVLGMAGKTVITTPFTYVATLSALLWEGCNVVFADIDEETCCLDPQSVAERLTPETAGILPVHIYGNICDVDSLDALAKNHDLRVLYDAAHSFGASYNNRSLLSYGDAAACSFHATKVFNTVEGGCLVTQTDEAREAFLLMRAYGHQGNQHFRLGINAKLSELHAAMGLCILDKVPENIAERSIVSAMYDALLPDKGLRRPALRQGLIWNHAYYPVILDDEKILERIVHTLAKDNIFPRRYFYPSLNTLPYIKNALPCPVAESVARRVLCLPLYAGLEEEIVERIAHCINHCLEG